MKRHGNGGEALLHRVEDGARSVGHGIENAYVRVRDTATDAGSRAVGFAREHPVATIATMAAGVGIGLFIARMLQDR